MSMSKIPRNASTEDRRSSEPTYRVPFFDGRYDRYCSSCAAVIENVALEKIPGLKCFTCGVEVEDLHKADGLYRPCPRCICKVRCTEKFCSACGRANYYFDPTKPARLEKQAFLRIKREIEQTRSLSESCLEDGDFSNLSTESPPVSALKEISTETVLDKLAVDKAN